MGSLRMNRYEGAVAVLKHIGVFFLGGNGAGTTSDFLATGSLQWTQGPALPMPMVYFCAVPISPTSFITIHKDKIHEFDAAIAGPTSDAGWRESTRWPALKTSRTNRPGCAKIGQKVIIAGGYNGGGLSSTRVFDLVNRRITSGGEMANPRRKFHINTIISGGEEKMFALAGYDGTVDTENTVDTVEEWVEESSTWKAADNLVEKRNSFGAVLAPRHLVC